MQKLDCFASLAMTLAYASGFCFSFSDFVALLWYGGRGMPCPYITDRLATSLCNPFASYEKAVIIRRVKMYRPERLVKITIVRKLDNKKYRNKLGIVG